MGAALNSFSAQGGGNLNKKFSKNSNARGVAQGDVGASIWLVRQTRTNCCGHIVADANVSPFARARNICCGHKFCVWEAKNVSDFVQKHFVFATNVSQYAQPKKHHGQQCVLNNVSSFTRACT